MPFTPAHSAIVLPFLRIRPDRASATGLVIGSIAPDFEYFFKMSVSSEYSHTLSGLLYFDIPVTIVLAFLFHQIIKQNLISNLPAFLQHRFQEIQKLDFKNYFKMHYWVVIISAGVGSFSHIFWDAFTHNDGFFAQQISWYKHVVIPFEGVRYPLFYGLQQISTFAGLTILVIYILLLKPQRQIPISKPSIVYWLIVILISGIILFLRFFFSDKEPDLGNFVVSSISAFLIAVLAGGLIKFRHQPADQMF